MARRLKTLTGEIEALSPEEMNAIDLLVRIAVRSRTPMQRRKPVLSVADSEKKFREKTEQGRLYQRGMAAGIRKAGRAE